MLSSDGINNGRAEGMQGTAQVGPELGRGGRGGVGGGEAVLASEEWRMEPYALGVCLGHALGQSAYTTSLCYSCLHSATLLSWNQGLDSQTIHTRTQRPIFSRL